MSSLIWAFAKRYAPIVTLPFAVVIGVIGYNIEWKVRSPASTPSYLATGVNEQRTSRLLHEDELRQAGMWTEKDVIPKTSLDRNPVGH